MNCPGCNTSIPPGRGSCPMCGATIEKILSDLGLPQPEEIQESAAEPKHYKPTDSTLKKCQYCAMDVPKPARICPYCRKKIKSSPVGVLIVALILFAILRAIVSQSVKTPESNSHTDAQIVKTSPSTQTPSRDFEHDLEERCKDWVYYRNRAYKLGKEGDPKGAAEAGAIMNRYYDDMTKLFSEKQITEAVGKIEASGYTGGF